MLLRILSESRMRRTVVTESNDTQIQNDDEQEDSRRLSLQGSTPPAEIEGYAIVRRLGTGAYGTVWLAREDRTGRMVAIKYYPHRRGLNWALLNREVEKLATLYTSRNIVRLLDVGWDAEPPYYVMEFVENGSLGAYLSGGPIPVDEAIRITRQVCGALIEAHGAGVLHCDLKPDNVLLDSQFQVRLCDFGQSRMSHEQSPALGTLYYMAPEQADLNAVADARWDVYAVGALLFHMLTGHPPYRTPALQKKLEAADSLAGRLVIYQDAIRSFALTREHASVRGVDSRLAAIVDDCLAVDPVERFPNAQAILDELDTRERQRSRRPLLLLGVLGPVLLLAAMVTISVNALRSNLKLMETKLTARALESDALSARILAASLQEELVDRLEELERVVADREIAEALESLMQRPSDDIAEEMRANHLKPFDERPRWMQLLDRQREIRDEANRVRNRSLDTSWFLTDAEGIQIWRRNFNSDTIQKDYSWRDYYHGRNIEYSPDEVPDDIEPIQGRHVSLPFRSEATDGYMVALSVPVRDSQNRVIGVFARTAHLGSLQHRLGRQIQSHEGKTVQRIIALADLRSGALLDHPWLTASVFQREASEVDVLFQQLELESSTLAQLRKVEDSLKEPGSSDNTVVELTVPRYRDPIANVPEDSVAPYRIDWMAAMVGLQDAQTPWLVIVQEDRAAALQPVEEMADRASRHAWLAVFSSIVMMGGIWLFVWFAISRTQGSSRLRHAVPGDSKKEDPEQEVAAE